MNKITIAASVIAALVLSACAPTEQAKSVEYYKAHKEEIAPKLAECTNKPGAVNCDAAGAADAIIKQEAWMHTPAKRGVW